MVFSFILVNFTEVNTDFTYQNLKKDTLQKIWGFPSFRPLQEEIIDSIISGRDTLCLLPTGGGKSLCYQLPALVSEGVCLVISPLLALMKDQVNHLQKLGIDADFLNSDLNIIEEDHVYANCKEGTTKILYISPERLSNQKFLMQAQEINFSFIAVDEAHCITEWGQDFRPSYQNITIFRDQFVNLPIIALTATATPKVLEQICEKLKLKKVAIYQQSFKRNNLQIHTIMKADKYEHLYHFLKLNEVSGLIYTNTRYESEKLSQFLNAKGLMNVDFFHAGLHPDVKERKQNWWMNSNQNVLISTNAFGMGIDKEHVRFVFHYSPPYSLENYYQEIGRAGRDGNESGAYMLWTEQDLLRADDILKNQTPTRDEYRKVVTFLYSIYQIADHEQTDIEFVFNINKLEKLTKLTPGKIKAVIHFLHQQELIYLKKSKSGNSSITLRIEHDQIETLSKSDAYFLELLQRTITGFTTGKVHFNEDRVLDKIKISTQLFQQRLKELQEKGYIEYLSNANDSIRFLQPRNEHMLHNQYWKLFYSILKNKIQKWEEMKYFIRESSFCRMRMILHYFGEKEQKDCGNCSYCLQKTKHSVLQPKSLKNEILDTLHARPSSLEELSIILANPNKEKILEELILLLDTGRIKMLNFRTYTIA